MVMERSGQGWCRQIGILGTEQPIGDFHPQGIGAFIATGLFQNRQPLFECLQGGGCYLVWTLRSRHNAPLKSLGSLRHDVGSQMQRALQISDVFCP